MRDEILVTITISSYHNKKRIIHDELRGLAVVDHNKPSHKDDLEFEILDFKSGGYIRGEDVYLQEKDFAPMPRPLFDLFKAYNDQVADQVRDKLIEKYAGEPDCTEHKVRAWPSVADNDGLHFSYGNNAGRTL
ncbi:MAG: hypothetical protein DHS20C07_18940 [Methyloligella sp.]|nr:MAG: hypothetical protein DHS20C07_18940 [Methyloligella sp.]